MNISLSEWQQAFEELQAEDAAQRARTRARKQKPKPVIKMAPQITVELHLAVSGRKEKTLAGWCLLKEGRSKIYAELS